DMLQNANREPDMAEVLRVTKEECKAGKLDGPWEVWAGAHGHVHSTVPFDQWLPTRRFPRVQGRTAASCKVRPIDDATASGLNLAVSTQERMRMAGLATLLDYVSFIAEHFRDWGEGGAPLVAKGNRAQACPQWPVHADDIPLLVCFVWGDSVGRAGGSQACAHKALPFGAFGAVWGYALVAASVNHPLRQIFSVPRNAYVDKFHRASPARRVSLHEWVFQELRAMLGIPLKEGKNQGPAAVLNLVGLVLSTAQWAGLRLAAKRRADIAADVESALRARRLSKRDAARLGGQLGFATAAMFGRVGHGGRSFSAHVPPHLCAELLQVGKKQRSAQSELLAVLVLLLSCPEEVRGARLVLFEDNTPALENMLSGAASDVWIEWVASESNPAGSLSRPDEHAKRAEARAFSQRHHLQAAEPRFPASFSMGADAWATAVVAAQEDWARNDWRHQALTALRLGAVDAGTLAALLAAISFDSDDKQIALGWIRARRAGAIVGAAHFHGGLLRLLCLAAGPRASCQGAATAVLRKAAWPRAPQGCRRCTAMACVRKSQDSGVPAVRWWPRAPEPGAAPLDKRDVVVGHYDVLIDGAKERRQAAPLRRLGLHGASAAARP
ncbi:unnamed protein product, partial [Prorocentrum cordatum]